MVDTLPMAQGLLKSERHISDLKHLRCSRGISLISSEMKEDIRVILDTDVVEFIEFALQLKTTVFGL